MITVRFFLDNKKEVFHFQDIDKFSQWINLYWKDFDCFEYMNSKKPLEKTIFTSKEEFLRFYKEKK